MSRADAVRAGGARALVVGAAPRLRERLAHAAPVLGLACLAVLALSGALIAASAAGNHTFLDPGARRGVRSWIDGPLAGLSVHASVAQFRLELAAMAAAYAGVLACARSLRARWIVATILMLHVVLLLAPPMLSTDAFNYVDYARLQVVHGLNPYAVVPADAASDPIYPFVHWRHTHAAYGPVFILGTAPLAWLGPAGALWGFKALAAASSLGCVALVWRIAARLGRSPRAAVAVFGLNPLLLVWTVGGAHNDLLMLLLVLAGIALILSRSPALGGAAIAAALAVKATAGLVIPFAVLGAREGRGRVAAGVAAAAVAVALVAFFGFSDHALGMVDTLRHERQLVGVYSVPNTVAQLFGATHATPSARALSTALLVIALASLAVAVWRGTEWIGACGWAFLAFLMAASWLLAWYAVWPLAFAAVARDRRLLVATLALQAYVVVNEVSLLG